MPSIYTVHIGVNGFYDHAYSLTSYRTHRLAEDDILQGFRRPTKNKTGNTKISFYSNGSDRPHRLTAQIKTSYLPGTANMQG